MTQRWRIRVSGKQREQINKELLVQAVLALGRQLAEEQRQTDSPTSEAPYETVDQTGDTP